MRRYGFLLLQYGFQYISRMGDVRQVNLGLDFLFNVSGRTQRSSRSRTRLAVRLEILADQLRFVLFQ